MRAKPLFAAMTMTLSPAFAGNEIAMEEIPSSVREAAIRTAPGLTFDRVEIELEGGVRVYEFQGVDPEGNRIEIDIMESGELDEIEMEVPVDRMPAAVRDGVFRRFPELEINRVETSVRSTGVFIYEIEGRFGGEEIAVEVAENGEILLIEGAAAS
ncbi:MAG: PepSY domain-containing protein [Parvularculaceae bacterium]|nr:PepSY domain-containing protein [Parvularculaceae bacterium]